MTIKINISKPLLKALAITLHEATCLNEKEKDSWDLKTQTTNSSTFACVNVSILPAQR